jgi:serine/threonine protein kinase
MPTDEDAKTLDDRLAGLGEITLANVAPGTKVFGRYLLEKEVGRGGMGVVWLAHDERVDMHVALKFLPDVVARDAECVDELKRELRRGLNLTHPGIVRVFSFEQDEQGAAISMEYVDGITLGALKLKQPSGCFDWDDLLPWVEQLCTALDYAHEEAKIVHRDLKPRNLMLTTKGRLKVADFGVATSISETMSRGTIRKDGSGTPPYMGPQQAFGEDPSPSDDIYSLGATLYELLTGRPPFYQGNILAQVQQRLPPSMKERREVLKVVGKKPIPEHWEKTVAACLAKHVEDRPQRASEVLEELRGVRQPPATVPILPRPINPAVTLSTAGEEPLGRKRAWDDVDTVEAKRPVPPPLPWGPIRPSKRSAGPGLAIAAVLTVLLIGAAVWWWPQDTPDQSSADSSELKPNGTPAIPIAQPVPTPQPEAKPPPPVKEQTEEALAAQAAADADAAAAGKIPMAGAPWTNSLNMKFVPVAGVAALVGEHEVRLIDYHTFAAETKRPIIPTEFDQGDNHPVVNVSWTDAKAFCDWLTKREQAEGKLGLRQRYRLLTDSEWSISVGLDGEQGATPEDKDSKIEGIYPWGTDWPPPPGTGNFPGEGETILGEGNELKGYQDGFSHTAQVGRFQPNAFGMYDLAGNVAEWVEDWFNAEQQERTIRGGAFIHVSRNELLSSFRWHMKPAEAADYVGFRIAIDLGSAAPAAPRAPTAAPAAPAAPQ